MLGSAKTNIPLLTLTSWVKGTSSFGTLEQYGFQNLAFFAFDHLSLKEQTKNQRYGLLTDRPTNNMSHIRVDARNYCFLFLKSENSAIINGLLQLTLNTKKMECTLQTSTAESHPPDMISGRTRCRALKYPRQNSWWKTFICGTLER